MVQQAISVKAKYGLRHRRASGGGLLGEDAAHPAAQATVAAGLRPRALTKAEQAKFLTRTAEYLEARYDDATALLHGGAMLLQCEKENNGCAPSCVEQHSHKLPCLMLCSSPPPLWFAGTLFL
jgi:hypothetical protein